MGSLSADSTSVVGETVIVVVYGGKRSLDALEWAIKYVIGPNDTLVVLGVLPDIGKKHNPSCLPFHLGVGTSCIYIKLEFSMNGELTPTELQDEIGKKKREYQKLLEPYYHHCKKMEVKLDIRLAAGLESKKVAVEEAKKLDPRWIVLDGYFKKDKEYVHKHVDCHLALLKTKGIATLIPSRITGSECEEWQTVCKKIDDQALSSNEVEEAPDSPKHTPLTRCSYPLSCETGFPRYFSLRELGEMTNGFNNISLKDHHRTIYRGVYGEFPVIVMCFPADDQVASLLKIMSRVRHRNILNLTGYCCTSDSIFFVCDLPKGSLEACLLSDTAARDLLWNHRWTIALDIGEGLRYLHEEFVDGSIVNLSLCSYNVAFSSNSFMLNIYETTTKQINLDDDNLKVFPSLNDQRAENIFMNDQLVADIKDYGILLLEIITGQSRRLFEKDGKSLVDWALPLLEKNLLNVLLDPRIRETSDPQVVDHMARAALACLKSDSNKKLSVSKVLAIVRGDH